MANLVSKGSMMKITLKTGLILFLLFNISFSQAPPETPVVASKVVQRILRRPVTFVGSVIPYKSSIIASEVEGLVDKILVSEGDYVKKGDVLVEFKTDTLELQLKESKSSKMEALSRYKLAQNNLKRFSELYEKGIASIQELQDAESEKNAWGARVNQFDSQINLSEYNLSVSKIKAPFTGYVVNKHTEVGQWVQEGGPVVELIETERLKIIIELPESYVSKLNKNDKVLLTFDALPDLKLDTIVDAIVPKADEQARTFPVRIVLDNEENKIKSGMVARASFLIGDEQPVTLVPKDAIVEFNNNKMVYVIENNLAKPVPVTPGFAFEDMIQVAGPLSEGQQVVIRGNERLRPDQPVKVISQPEFAN